MRATVLRLASIIAIPVALLGALVVALSLAGLWMVVIEGMAPGEPIWADAQAPSMKEALTDIASGTALVTLALTVRALVRRKLR